MKILKNILAFGITTIVTVVAILLSPVLVSGLIIYDVAGDFLKEIWGEIKNAYKDIRKLLGD